MSCGCTGDICSCFINDTNTVSVGGSGGSGSPYALSVIPAPDLGLQNVALGVAILLDPDPCNLLTLSGDGLLGKVYVEAGANVNVTGCGTVSDPLVIEATGGGGGELAEVLPGDIWMTARGTAGPGWVLCDGTFYDSVADPQYAALYTEIGITYGGTGPDNFAVPDGLGRSPMGAGAGAGLTARARGQEFGEELHTLLETELASHTHVDTGGHTHTVPDHDHGGSTGSVIGGMDAGMGTVPGVDPGSDYTVCTASGGGIGVVNLEAGDHAHPISAETGVTTGSGDLALADAGSDAGHNTVHPCFVVNYKIKL